MVYTLVGFRALFPQIWHLGILKTLSWRSLVGGKQKQKGHSALLLSISPEKEGTFLSLEKKERTLVNRAC